MPHWASHHPPNIGSLCAAMSHAVLPLPGLELLSKLYMLPCCMGHVHLAEQRRSGTYPKSLNQGLWYPNHKS